MASGPDVFYFFHNGHDSFIIYFFHDIMNAICRGYIAEEEGGGEGE